MLVELPLQLEDFIGELPSIDAEVRALQARHQERAAPYSVKRLFVQRRAVKGVKEKDAVAIENSESISGLREITICVAIPCA